MKVKILRTSDKDGTSRKGFKWPSEGFVEAPDWDPKPHCGGGLHGLLNGEGDLWHLDWETPDALWQVVSASTDTIVDLDGKVKFPSGEVIYSGDTQGAFKALGETRESMIARSPEWAYMYAFYVDKGPREDTRRAACKTSYWACYYALYVDKGPREDTRLAACKDPQRAKGYAWWEETFKS